MRGGTRSPQLAPRSDAWSSYRTARGVPQEQHDALCAIHCKRCEVPRRFTSAVTAALLELYRYTAPRATRFSPARSCAKSLPCQESSNQLGLASTQRSRAAWIAHSLQRFNEAV